MFASKLLQSSEAHVGSTVNFVSTE
jgi:hypothetical protein